MRGKARIWFDWRLIFVDRVLLSWYGGKRVLFDVTDSLCVCHCQRCAVEWRWRIPILATIFANMHLYEHATGSWCCYQYADMANLFLRQSQQSIQQRSTTIPCPINFLRRSYFFPFFLSFFLRASNVASIASHRNFSFWSAKETKNKNRLDSTRLDSTRLDSFIYLFLNKKRRGKAFACDRSQFSRFAALLFSYPMMTSRRLTCFYLTAIVD